MKNGEINIETKEYRIVLSPMFIEEIEIISFNIVKKLKSKKLAQEFLNNIIRRVQEIKEYSYIYPKLGKQKILNKICRKSIINNYVILYTVDKLNMQIDIVHIYNQKEDYFNKILSF